jgi:hypothetical protein
VTAVYPEPLSGDVNPYPVTEIVPYDPDSPEFTDPVTPTPEPEREHLSAEQAIARQAEAEAAAAEADPVATAMMAAPPGEPPMVTRYKAGL